jgi:hypothetical protein
MKVIEVAIDEKHSRWFKQNRRWPVRVLYDDKTVQVEGGSSYKILKTPEGLKLFKFLTETTVLEVGTISKELLIRPISEAARYDLGAIRAALWGVKYPAPLAYRMRGGDLVHPGKCFQKYSGVMVKDTLFYINGDDDDTDDEAPFCAVCKERF